MNEMKIAKKEVLAEAVAILVTVRWYCLERAAVEDVKRKKQLWDILIFYFNFLNYLIFCNY